MARISGVDLPNDKRVEIGLTYIYGIGRTTSNEIIKATGINPDTRCRDLTEDDVKKLSDYITLAINALLCLSIGCSNSILIFFRQSITVSFS